VTYLRRKNRNSSKNADRHRDKVNIRVRFFASLKQHLGQAELQLEISSMQTVAALWETLSAGKQALPKQILFAVNQEYVHAEYCLKDGDEVVFFPPVTEG